MSFRKVSRRERSVIFLSLYINNPKGTNATKAKENRTLSELNTQSKILGFVTHAKSKKVWKKEKNNPLQPTTQTQTKPTHLFLVVFLCCLGVLGVSSSLSLSSSPLSFLSLTLCLSRLSTS
jgi:hypothetical protein